MLNKSAELIREYRADRDEFEAECIRLRAEVARLREALGECWPVLDSFVNGQGAVTMEEIEQAHEVCDAALGGGK